MPIGPIKIDILGTNISAVNMGMALNIVDQWIDEGRSDYICFRDVHGVMAAQKDATLRAAHEKAGMVAPDGMPLVWTSRARGHPEVGRVSGPDFMLALCDRSVALGYRHYLYGGAPGVADKLALSLSQRFPGVQIVGSYCPPFRKLTPEEDEFVIKDISETRAQLVWIGLGSPKQEHWMADHVERIPGAILFGVGAAFDFHAGIVKRAPLWMQKSGLEWLFRLLSEPRRLWRRYVIMAPKFLVQVLLQSSKTKNKP